MLVTFQLIVNAEKLMSFSVVTIVHISICGKVYFARWNVVSYNSNFRSSIFSLFLCHILLTFYATIDTLFANLEFYC